MINLSAASEKTWELIVPDLQEALLYIFLQVITDEEMLRLEQGEPGTPEYLSTFDIDSPTYIPESIIANARALWQQTDRVKISSILDEHEVEIINMCLEVLYKTNPLERLEDFIPLKV